MKSVKVVIGENYVSSIDGDISKRLSDAEVEVLKALVEAGGETLTRDHLMTLGWPGKVVVSNSLNMAILALRRSLEPFGLDKCIITVPKVGFRLDNGYLFEINKVDSFVEKNIDDESEACAHVMPDVILKNDISKLDGGWKTLIISYRAIRLTKMSIFLLLVLCFYFWIWLQHLLHKPDVSCEKVVDGVVLCAINIDSVLRKAAYDYIKENRLADVEIWGEINPHALKKHKFYIVNNGGGG